MSGLNVFSSKNIEPFIDYLDDSYNKTVHVLFYKHSASTERREIDDPNKKETNLALKNVEFPFMLSMLVSKCSKSSTHSIL